MDDELTGLLEEVNALSGEIENENELEATLDTAPVEVVINNHNLILHRSDANQHPISAITGLAQEIVDIKSRLTANETNIAHKIRTVTEVPSDLQVHEYIFLEKGE